MKTTTEATSLLSTAINKTRITEQHNASSVEDSDRSIGIQQGVCYVKYYAAIHEDERRWQ